MCTIVHYCNVKKRLCLSVSIEVSANHKARQSRGPRKPKNSTSSALYLYPRALSKQSSRLKGGDEIVHSIVFARHLLHGGGSEPIAEPLARIATATTARKPNPSHRPPLRWCRGFLENLAEAFVLRRLQLVNLEVVKSHLQRSRVPVGRAVGYKITKKVSAESWTDCIVEYSTSMGIFLNVLGMGFIN